MAVVRRRRRRGLCLSAAFVFLLFAAALGKARELNLVVRAATSSRIHAQKAFFLLCFRRSSLSGKVIFIHLSPLQLIGLLCFALLCRREWVRCDSSGHGRDDEAEAISASRALDSAATRGIAPPVVPSPVRSVLPLPPGAGGDSTGQSDRAGRVLPGSLEMQVRQQAIHALNSSILPQTLRSVHIIVIQEWMDSFFADLLCFRSSLRCN